MSGSGRSLNGYSAILIPLRFSRELDGLILLIVFGSVLLLLNPVADRFHAELALLMLLLITGALVRLWQKRPAPAKISISAAFACAFFDDLEWRAFSPMAGTYVFRRFGIVRWRDCDGHVQVAWLFGHDQCPESWRRLQVIWRWGDRTAPAGIG
ncbi:MAG: hypothetical protein AB8F65_07055 [Woeseiaceae bacterium]